MSYQYEILSEDNVEPVTLAEAKAYMRIDSDYSADDDIIETFITASRQRLELYLNVGFVEKTIQLQWSGCGLSLPFSPNNMITSVIEVGGDPLTTDQYTVRGLRQKQIAVNSIGGIGFELFYPINQGWPEIWSGNALNTTQYDVIYVTGDWGGQFPKALKQALLSDIDYMYKNQGYPEQIQISTDAISLSAGYSQNLIIQN